MGHAFAHLGTGVPTKLKNLAADLVERFIVLEHHGLSHHRHPWPAPDMPEDLVATLRSIEQRLGSSLSYLRSDAPDGHPSQVMVLVMHCYVRSGRADTLVDRLDQWFASPASANLRESLAQDPLGTERIAFLILDTITEPETRGAEEQDIAFCPTRASGTAARG